MVLAVAAVVVAGAVVLAAPSLTDVVDKGHDIRPYHSGLVYKIRVADSFTVYADEESKPELDSVSGSVLVALATASLIAYLIVNAARRERRLRRFYALASAGFAALAFDEFFAIHETIGHNLPFLTDLPGITHPDDVLFAALVIPTLAFVYFFRDILLGASRPRLMFAGALAAFFLAAFSDLADLSADEPLELVCAAFIVGGFISLLVSHIGACIAPPPKQPSAEPPRERAPA